MKHGWRLNCLTAQPFLPKLRLTKYMSRKHMRLGLVLLLGIVFLAGQFHVCADPTATHVCPFCTTAGSAILIPAPSISLVPVLDRLEVAAVAFEVSAEAPRTTSPRAPPTL